MIRGIHGYQDSVKGMKPGFSYLNVFLYSIFFLYPFIGLQLFLSESNTNIPVSDIVAMVLGVFFIFILIGQTSRTMQLPIVNARGIAIYLCFLIIAGLSIANSVSLSASVKYFFRNPFYYFVVYFVAMGSIFIWNGKEALSHLYNVLCASSFAVALVSLITSGLRIRNGAIWGIYEIPYLTINHKTIAVTLAGNLPLLMAMNRNLRGKNAFCYAITIVMVSAAIILSFSKTAWMALVLILCIFKLREIKVQSLLKIVIFVLLLTLLSVSVYYSYSYFASVGETARAEGSRLILALLSIKIFMEHPITGGGIGSFIFRIARYEDEVSYLGRQSIIQLDAHGMVFKLLSETGFLGLFFFSLFLFSILIRIYKTYMAQKRSSIYCANLMYGCFISLLALIAMTFFFGTDTYSSRLWFPLSFISAQGYALREDAS